MKHTTLEDLSVRLPWRIEAMSTVELAGIMRVRERRAYRNGFEDGARQGGRSRLGLLYDTLAAVNRKIEGGIISMVRRIFSRLR
jgi:hypothetical protein